MERIVYPIGDSSFEYIRRNGQFYVDKTSYVYNLVSGSKYYFLSRPRRFGKSLLVSTLEAYFSGKRELFEGLELGRHETEWKRYPIFHFDFSMGEMSSVQKVESALDLRLSEWERTYGRNQRETTFGLRIRGVMRRAHEATGMNVVVLVDEYDNPLFSTFEDNAENERIRDILKDVYLVFKSEAAIIRFCFLTGVTRFSKMSVFSGLNNLYDITLVPDFSGICGITQQEVEKYCGEGVDRIAECNGLDNSEALLALKEHYDGYHFGDLNVDVYNPYSLIQAFASGKIASYWFMSGTSQFLWRRISRLASQDTLQKVFSPIMDESQLGAHEGEGLSLEALLFQTGYLTIKEKLYKWDVYQLGIPNEEVMDGIMKNILPFVSRNSQVNNLSDLSKLRRYAENGEVDRFMGFLQSVLAGISYRLTKKEPEIYYENNLFILFNLIGIETQTEVETSEGRMDVTMRIGNYRYIIELKRDGSSEKALKQIEDKGYARSYLRYEQPIILIGVNFSSATRNIESWKWEKLQ